MSFKKIIEEYNIEDEEKRRTTGIYIRLYYTRTKNNRVRTENRRTQPKKNEEKWKLLSSNYFYYYINRNSDLLLTILLYDLYIKLHRN